ncbi:MAG: response regulator [Candidatus Woesearchaeota archaeon]
MNNNNINGKSDLNKYNFSGKNILVVDDDLPSVIYATFALKKAGAIVTSANDGEQAVDIASKGNIDLILMDVVLPKKNGIDAMREIRQFNRDVPIIAYTANSSAETKYECFNAGCKEYLLKPVLPDAIYSAVDKCFNPIEHKHSE